MSLELGRSSAARDDSDDGEATEVKDAATESGANRAADEEAADETPRRSVLAPFMIASSADDTDDAASDTVSHAASDADSVTAEAPEDDEIPSTSGAASTAGATVGPGDAKAPATDWADSAAGGEEDPVAVTADDGEAAGTADDEGTTAARPEDAATSDAGGLTGSGVPGQGDADDRSPSGWRGVDSPQAGAAGAATGIPAPRSATAWPGRATGPGIDSGGPGEAGADVDGPLLEDAEGLRTNWLRLQAAFVDDPHEAVSDAADLVEHTAQALVGALRMRQQRLREMWDGQGAPPAAADTTEQLRLLMQRYRVLFNHICKS